MKGIHRRIIVSFLVPVALSAQNLTGSWQGTLRDAAPPVRMILRITTIDGRRLAAALASIEEGDGFDRYYAADTVALRGSNLTMTWPEYNARYTGTINPDGTTIQGMWTEGSKSQPLPLERATSQTRWTDVSAHKLRLVTVEKSVVVEALDWVGSGRPIVLLAGNGNTAHVFDQLAPKLTGEYHVYGITRRGFGNSSAPTTGYLSDSLADDVLAVMDSLGIRRPVVIGHSLAGQELSSIGSRHPDRVAGLVYLDAGYQYAFFDSAQNNTGLSIRDTQRKLARLVDPAVAMSIRDRGAMIAELLQTSLPLMERDMRVWQRELAARPNQLAIAPAAQHNPVSRAIAMGHQKYTALQAPVLAIFALPREVPTQMVNDAAKRAAWDSLNMANLGPQIDAFERGVPSARVVRLPHANHYVFRSNEAEVLRRIRGFISELPATQ